MPPKRPSPSSTSGPSPKSSPNASRRSSAKRSRTLSKCRQLSDIAEESIVQSIEAHTQLFPADDFSFLVRTRSQSKKRSFDAAQLGEGDRPTPEGIRIASNASGARKDSGTRGGNRRKTIGRQESEEEIVARLFGDEVEAHAQEPLGEALEQEIADVLNADTSLDETINERWELSSALVTRTTPEASLYISPPSLLYWTHALDTSADTEVLALNLVDLTLSPPKWHQSLSGVVQPAACFLVASLLTRRQNLVEDIVAALEEYQVGFEQVVKGYAALWERGVLFKGEVVGGYGERAASLPSPVLLMGEEGVDEEYA